MAQQTVTALRLIGLTRKSKGEDMSTHIVQRERIEARAKAEGWTVTVLPPEKGVKGSKDWRKRGAGQALAMIEAGQADGIIVADQDRISRESYLATAEMWEAFQDAGAVFVACDGTDSRAEGSEMMFTIKAAIAREQWKQYQRRSNAGRARAVEVEGVHGGDMAPVGYKFSERADVTTNIRGAAKHGPLVPVEPEASRVRALFAAYGAEDEAMPSWSAGIALAGVRSKNGVHSILTNRVYLGQARSGEYTREAAHEALTDAETFERVQRRLGTQAEAYGGRKARGAKVDRVLAKVLRCHECKGVLSPYPGKSDVEWKCRTAVSNAKTADGTAVCSNKGSISNPAMQEFAIGTAQAWHAAAYPSYALGREVDAATIKPIEDALKDAERKAKEYAADGGMSVEQLPVGSKYAEAIRKAKADLAAFESAQGWIAQSPEAVAEMLAEGDAATVNGFLIETIRVFVKPCGQGATKAQRAPENRVQVLYLDHGRSASGEDPETMIPLPEKVAAA